MDIGRIGIWNGLLSKGDPIAQEATGELEELGYGAVWLGGNSGVTGAAALVAATSRITVANGILNIWEHTAEDVAAEAAAVEEAHPGRYLLGLGASHAPTVKNYHKPYSTMVAYLDTLDAAPRPVPAARRVLAALGPKMLKLAGTRAAGAHPYLVTPQHTAEARDILGPDALLAPEVKVVLSEDAGRARAIGRQALAMYLRLPNYTNNWLRLGFTEEDFRAGGSDRLVDATVVWGSPGTVRSRIAEYHEAGADHVAVQLLDGNPDSLPRAGWRELAGEKGAEELRRRGGG
ncbi:LLM class F420-dependent oxidoreductase, partial [Streptomyces sp. SPB074]|uniref:LLM class F420-dependent oxidoreductase n=1 Tax=Streptomyces sp. (strain SPB074) TaxID=465543 RepID=UPI0001D1DB23